MDLNEQNRQAYNNPLFSIITINRNNKIGLEDTIKSVISQTSKNYEYIVIDGASTDGSLQVINKYREKISYWVSEPDKGIYNAMNKGIEQASGEYCLFMNSGDLIASSIVLEVVEQKMNLGKADFMVGDTLFSKNRVVIKNKKDIVPEELVPYNLFYISLPHQSTFIRTKLLKNRPYDETKKICSDWKQMFEELVLRSASYKKISGIDVAIYDITGLSSISKLDERELIFKELFPPLLSSELIEEIRQRQIIVRLKYNHRRLYKILLTIFNLLKGIRRLF